MLTTIAINLFQRLTINFPMPRNCDEGRAISKYCLGNSMVVIQVNTTFW